jgi:hypothetical protein
MGCVTTAFCWIASICTTKAMFVNGFLWAKLDKRTNNEAHGIIQVDNNKW